MQIDLETLLEVILENKQEKLIGECLRRQLGAGKSGVNKQIDGEDGVYIATSNVHKINKGRYCLVLQGFKNCDSKLGLVKAVKECTGSSLAEANEFVDNLQNNIHKYGILKISHDQTDLNRPIDAFRNEFPDLDFHIHKF